MEPYKVSEAGEHQVLLKIGKGAETRIFENLELSDTSPLHICGYQVMGQGLLRVPKITSGIL